MIEFALATPFVLLILISILFFGRYFLVAQVLLHAAQEGARVASSIPNLSDETTRDNVRGFSTAGTQVNSQSVIYATIASAGLLSQGNTGNMPPGSRVEILPWDADGTTADITPPGTVQVRIDYPFQLVGNPFTGPTQQVSVAMSLGTGAPIKFSNFTISQRVVSAQEIYQQVQQN